MCLIIYLLIGNRKSTKKAMFSAISLQKEPQPLLSIQTNVERLGVRFCLPKTKLSSYFVCAGIKQTSLSKHLLWTKKMQETYDVFSSFLSRSSQKMACASVVWNLPTTKSMVLFARRCIVWLLAIEKLASFNVTFTFKFSATEYMSSLLCPLKNGLYLFCLSKKRSQRSYGFVCSGRILIMKSRRLALYTSFNTPQGLFLPKQDCSRCMSSTFSPLERILWLRRTLPIGMCVK